MSVPMLRQALRSRGILSLGSPTRHGYKSMTSPGPSAVLRLPSARLYSDQQKPFTGGQPKYNSPTNNKDTTPQFEGLLETERKSRIGPWFTVLLIAGMGLSAYGLGEIWGSMTIWPQEIRSDLRHGLREDVRGDRTMSQQYLSRAWETAKKMPIDAFGRNAFLKTSGIAIALAGVYEADCKGEKAYQVYQEALNQLQEGSEPTSRLRTGLSSPEHMRAVAISYKLGGLAEKLDKPKEEEEKWLVYSVETVLRDVMGAPAVADFTLQHKNTQEDSEAWGIAEDLRLPKWVFKHDLAAPFEALGSLYSRTGKVSYAMPLYLQAISILIPPGSQISGTEDQCRGAQLMGNISELILRTNNDYESLIQAESWSNKGLDIASRMRKSTVRKYPTCEVAYAFMLYNLAMIREMAGDQSKARQLFTESLDQSKSIGLQEGIHNAEKAIQDLGRGVTTVTSLLPKAQP